MRAAGYVLAGGRSTRMGRDKALLPWQGVPLLIHMLGVVREVTGSAIVLGPNSRYGHLNVECWDDLHPDAGPIAGLETALSRSSADWNLIVAVDTPTAGAALLRGLLDRTETSAAQAIAARDPGGQLHPLCAVYHRRALAPIQQLMVKGEFRMMTVLQQLTCETVDLAAPLANLNHPNEWRDAMTTVSLL